MTFGRAPNDPLSSAGFGTAPALGSRLDAPYGDGVADGFGGRGPTADGFGRPPTALAAGQEPDAYAPDRERPVSHADLAESEERGQLVGAYKDVVAVNFDDMYKALETTCRRLEVHKPKKSALLVEMVNLAASAALAGAAGVVAEILAKRLSSQVMAGFDRFKQSHQRFANDAIKEHLKKSFHLGIATHADVTEAELARAFEDAQYKKFRNAKKMFFTSFGEETGREMMRLPVPVLREALRQAREDGETAGIVEATSQQIAVEWANLVARVKHGAGDWDPWAGEHGSAGAVPTRDAATRPTFAHDHTEKAEHPSAGNVDPESATIESATDDDQRTMNPTLHGILEINLWGYKLEGQRHRRFELFTHHGHGMRLAGVSDHVKRLIAEFPRVRDIKMNKVVALYDNEQLNPPKPVGRFLITADGYIRQSTMWGGEAEMQDAADFAQDLSPVSLQ